MNVAFATGNRPNHVSGENWIFSGHPPMHQSYPDLLHHSQDHSVVWRYLTMGKFEDMIFKRRLNFQRLSQQKDQDEGRLSKPSHDERFIASSLRKVQGMPDNSDIPDRNAWKGREVLEYFENWNRCGAAVSCWTNRDDECLRMWREYTQHGKEPASGIAIKSTPKRLKEAIGTGTSRPHFIADVIYTDDPTAFNQGILSFRFKGTSYQWEREVRVVLFEAGEPLPFAEGRSRQPFSPDGNGNEFLEVDLCELIAEVYISPFASDSVLPRVQKMLSEAGVTASARKSRIT